jgi:hypothetical protein
LEAGDTLETFQFDEAKFISILIAKHKKLKHHLASNHVKSLPEEKI